MVKQSRRSRRTKKKRSTLSNQQLKTAQPKTVEESIPKEIVQRSFFNRIYHDHYNLLLIIPFTILLLAILQIGLQVAHTGDFLNRGVSLKGGLTITIPIHNESVTIQQLRQTIVPPSPNNDIIVRGIFEFGSLKGVSITASESTGKKEVQLALEKNIIDQVKTFLPNAPAEYSVEVIGPSLGKAFFQQTFKAVIIAFLLMGMVIFLYFGEEWKMKLLVSVLVIVGALLVFKGSTFLPFFIAGIIGVTLLVLFARYSVPSAAVILAAMSDILVTLAVVNIIGIKISTAGIAAFLMLIGYSVDTDILLSTRVLKHKKGVVYDRVISSLKTGIIMSLTSIAAAFVGLLISQSETIRQIMLIILIGLMTDIVMTWIQNTSIIRGYAKKRGLK